MNAKTEVAVRLAPALEVLESKLLMSAQGLAWTTYLGGDGYEDSIAAVKVDLASGDVVVAGNANTPGLATSGAYRTSAEADGADGFVAKFHPDGSLVWFTYLGGNGIDYVTDIVLGPDGAVYATGYVQGETKSDDFATAGAWQTVPVGDPSFVAKLSADGSTLLWCTLFSGDDSDSAMAIDLDSAGNVYIAGQTSSTDLGTPGAYRKLHSAGYQTDAFVAKFSDTGSSLLYCTYFGGAGYDYCNNLAVDSAGNVFFVGYTHSAGLATSGAYDTVFDTTKSNRTDAFIAELAAGGGSLVYSTYLGGTEYEEATSVVLEGGSAYVGGYSNSALWQAGTTITRYGSGGGSGDGFVVKVNAAGSALTYCAFLGGSADEAVSGIDLGADGKVYASGWTESSGLATANAFDSTIGGAYDGFVAAIGATGSVTHFSYLGGGDTDFAYQIDVDPRGRAYIVGDSTSIDMATAGAWDTQNNGNNADGFLTQVDFYLPADGNFDNIVDQADYTLWYNSYGGIGLWLPGNYNNDPIVDQADYTLWYNSYGATGGAGASAPSGAAAATGPSMDLLAAASQALQVGSSPLFVSDVGTLDILKTQDALFRLD